MHDKALCLNTTKAETLFFLSKKGFNIPTIEYFTTAEWNRDDEKVLLRLLEVFKNTPFLAVRSSSLSEDTEASSMAGAFCSILHVPTAKESLKVAIKDVIISFARQANQSNADQVLVQPMVHNVVMAGVVMSKVLDDGSPYYVINYDDSSGRTDSITSGDTINKTVYVYHGVQDSDFDSPRLLSVVRLVKQLEKIFSDLPLDIEFAIDSSETLYLLQVRRICSTATWNKKWSEGVSQQISYVREYVQHLMTPRYSMYGDKTILGVMPDWNPAEMIGIVPRPLAASLYRHLITKDIWAMARREMGYRNMQNIDLMVMVSGHAYIDVRNSFNSFLPNNLTPKISVKLINCWLDRLEADPHLHDKVEFEIINTVLDFDFHHTFQSRYHGLLSPAELSQYEGALRNLTQKALSNSQHHTLMRAENSFTLLNEIQKTQDTSPKGDSFIIADIIGNMLEECRFHGTLPFSIAARHGFIAESFFRSAIRRGAINKERIDIFKQSIRTITREMSDDFYAVYTGALSQNDFIKRYGHLRPSSYDILSPTYKNRPDLFEGSPHTPHPLPPFTPSKEEIENLSELLSEIGITNINGYNLFDYAARAIKGREYGKFIFSRHLSQILEYCAEWAEIFGFSRDDISFLPIEAITNFTFASLPINGKEHLQNRIESAKEEYNIAQAFKLSYLIRSCRDVYVVPQQRTAPNFTSRKHIEAPIVYLTPNMSGDEKLEGAIICIEGADPGYDWIFTRNIAGLVTKFGGANSHMAIRCAEYNLPAAIGCGEQTFERILQAGACSINCPEKRLLPVQVGS